MAVVGNFYFSIFLRLMREFLGLESERGGSVCQPNNKITSKVARANSVGGQFLFLFFHLQFPKIYAYMHLFYFIVTVYFLYYVLFTGSTNLLLQPTRYNLLLYVHHPLWSSSLSQSLTRIHFFLLIVFLNNAIKLYFSMAMPMVFQLLTFFLDRTLTIYLVGPHLLLKLLQF